MIGIVMPGIYFTDFDPLTREPDVEWFACRGDGPSVGRRHFSGNKTHGSGPRLRPSARDRLARRVLAEGGTVGGICGGYQLLGQVIRDPQHLESDEDHIDGLGMLPVDTTFAFPKIVEQVSEHAESGCTSWAMRSEWDEPSFPLRPGRF